MKRLLCVVLLLSLFTVSVSEGIGNAKVEDDVFALASDGHNVQWYDGDRNLAPEATFTLISPQPLNNLFGNFTVNTPGVNITFRLIQNGTTVIEEMANATFGSIHWLNTDESEVNYEVHFVNNESSWVNVNLRFWTRILGPDVTISLVPGETYTGVNTIHINATCDLPWETREIHLVIDESLAEAYYNESMVSYEWDTTEHENGSIVVAVFSWDNWGLLGSWFVTVNVSNAISPTTTTTTPTTTGTSTTEPTSTPGGDFELNPVVLVGSGLAVIVVVALIAKKR
ncbi:MAG: hypothetical protein ACFFEA_00935 [Candidatus Thorarchaeota archaeon]